MMNCFNDIKKITNGYLSTDVYEKLYLYAKDAKQGIILDVGPAQGGSTVCFSMAMQDNDALEKIITIDKFYGSAALKYNSGIEKNISVIKENLRYFELAPHIEFFPFDELDENDFKDEKIALLFIDADGAVDREFRRYFNSIVSGGIIIIDDYEKIINLQARTHFLKMQDDRNIRCFLEHNHIKHMEDYAFLGKQYLTYSLVNYFEDRHLIEILENCNGTIFCRKRQDAPLYGDENTQDIKKIRQKNKALYLECRERIVKEYRHLGNLLRDIMKVFQMNHAVLYDCFYYEVKDRMELCKVYEIHADSEDYIEDDFMIQDIPLDSLYNVDLNGTICRTKGDGNIIDDFLEQMGYENRTYIILRRAEGIHGVLVLFDNADRQYFPGSDGEELTACLNDEITCINGNIEKILYEFWGRL